MVTNVPSSARPVVRSWSPELLRSLLGPAEAQYGEQVLILGLEGNQGSLACGSTVVDQSADDLDPDPREVGIRYVWNDLTGETGYRIQWDYESASYVTEDSHIEHSANTVQQPQTYSAANPPATQTTTARIFGHVGHAPDHGNTPIAGDVVSNTCSITYEIPSPP